MKRGSKVLMWLILSVPNAVHSTVGFRLKRVGGLFDCM